MKRQNGYYWVLSQHNIWTVAQLLEGDWYNIGLAHPLTESHFLQIGESIPSNESLKTLREEHEFNEQDQPIK